MLSEVRVARIVEAIGRYRGGTLSCVEAAEALGMSERHFRRLRDRYEAEGAEGLIDRRRGRATGRRAPVDRIEWVLDQYRTRYFDHASCCPPQEPVGASKRSRTIPASGTVYCHKAFGRGLSTGISMQR